MHIVAVRTLAPDLIMEPSWLLGFPIPVVMLVQFCPANKGVSWSVVV